MTPHCCDPSQDNDDVEVATTKYDDAKIAPPILRIVEAGSVTGKQFPLIT
jgi:hypothetical protein